ERAVDGEARREDGRLRVGRELQRLLGPLEAEPGEREGERLVRRLEDPTCDLRLLEDLAAHAHFLTALTRIDERDSGHEGKGRTDLARAQAAGSDWKEDGGALYDVAVSRESPERAVIDTQGTVRATDQTTVQRLAGVAGEYELI